MKKKLLPVLLFFCCYFGYGQKLHNPYALYDEANGLFDMNLLRTLDIEFYDAAYDSILQVNWFLDSGLRIPATIRLNNDIELDDVAIRYKGNSTFVLPQAVGSSKLPLNIDINRIVDGQELMGYRKLKLANGMSDPTFCKEVLAYDIYRRYLPAAEANYLKVNVQGNYLGLYINIEPIDKHFLEKHYGETDGVLFKCDPVQRFNQPGPSGNSDLEWLGSDSTLYYNHYDLKSDYGWQELLDLIYILNHEPEYLDSVLNIDRVLWAFALNTTIPNLDSYNGLYPHNYYLYKTKDGLFQMIPWDLSESFIGALLGLNPQPEKSIYEYDPYQGFNSFLRPPGAYTDF